MVEINNKRYLEILEELKSLSPSENAIMNMIDLFNSKKGIIEKLQKENESLQQENNFLKQLYSGTEEFKSIERKYK